MTVRGSTFTFNTAFVKQKTCISFGNSGVIEMNTLLSKLDLYRKTSVEATEPQAHYLLES